MDNTELGFVWSGLFFFNIMIKNLLIYWSIPSCNFRLQINSNSNSTITENPWKSIPISIPESDLHIIDLRHLKSQGKLQRGLFLCINLCHVVIKAAFVQYCNTKLLSITKIQMLPNFVLQYWTSVAWFTTWHSLIQRSRPRCNLPCEMVVLQ